MTTIRATCPTCGEVELLPDDLEVKIYKGRPHKSEYTFLCPVCEELVQKPADDRVIQLLISGGVRVITIEPSSEEIVEPHYTGPPLTENEILDFMLLDNETFEGLLENLYQDPDTPHS